MAELTPTREEFHDLARRYSIIAIRRELLADQISAVGVFSRLCADGPGFLLESVDHGGRWSRWSFVGRHPIARFTSRDGVITVEGELEDVSTDGGMLGVLDRLLARYRSPLVDDLPFHSGLVGYLGYDVVREVEPLGAAPPSDRGWPDAVVSIAGEVVALDHWSQRAVLIANVVVPDLPDDPAAAQAALDRCYAGASAAIERMARDGATPLDEPMVDPPDLAAVASPDAALPAVRSTMTPATFEAAVEAARERIFEGDIFQVVLSQRFDLELDADPFDLYRVLRQVNPSPYMYFVREPGLTLVGCSPEPMVQLLDGQVISRPIAGTRKRGATDDADRRLGAELLEHPKERAEHIMLVDLARNDVGRVVRFGTEEVDELLTLERYSHVMHLTSQVSGELADGLGPIDVLRATLPAGTVSGAPKVSAMRIIDELEPARRGPYAGVVGYIDFSGNIDTAIAIRTMIIDGDRYEGRPLRASVQAGAGIVADSVASDEDLECNNKARALLAAVVPAERMTRQRLLGGAVAAPLHRDLFAVSGPDALRFLQGQLSADVDELETAESAWSLLLEPQGRIAARVRVTRSADDEYLIDVDEGWGGTVVARLDRFRFRVDVSIGGVRSVEMCAVRGVRPAPPTGVIALDCGWPTTPGADLFAPDGTVPDTPEPIRRVSAVELERRRILAGVPAMGSELDASVIPAEAGRWLVESAASFTKGCYVGQELVARVASRGSNTPRRLRTISIDAAVPPAGAALWADTGEVGSLSSVAVEGTGAVALAFVRRGVDPGSILDVRWERDGAAFEARGTVLAGPDDR